MSHFKDQLMSIKLKKPGENDSERQKTVLELVREKGMDPNYGCQEGYCGACRCKLKSGEVEHTEDTIAWRDDGEIIPCTAKVKSDEIEISYDM